MKEFVQEQVKLKDSVLKECETREKLREKITELYDYPRYDPPFKRGDKYFYFHNTGLQPQNVLYVQVSIDYLWIIMSNGNLFKDLSFLDSIVTLALFFRIVWMENQRFC